MTNYSRKLWARNADPAHQPPLCIRLRIRAYGSDEFDGATILIQGGTRNSTSRIQGIQNAKCVVAPIKQGRYRRTTVYVLLAYWNAYFARAYGSMTWYGNIIDVYEYTS